MNVFVYNGFKVYNIEFVIAHDTTEEQLGERMPTVIINV